jgi:hypothetical protein
LWADAICINQDDNKEKSRQIRLIAQVFQSAAFLIAYLGQEEGGSDPALRTLMQIRAKEANLKEWPKSLLPMPSWEENGIPSTNDKVWKVIGTLFSRKWFRRVWIIQEVVAAASIKVVCGKW